MLRDTLDHLRGLWDPLLRHVLLKDGYRTLPDGQWVHGTEHTPNFERQEPKSEFEDLSDFQRCDHLMLGTERQLFDFRPRLWAWITSDWKPFADLFFWKKQREGLQDAYRQFFGRKTWDPAFVWVTNVWHQSASSLWEHGFHAAHEPLGCDDYGGAKTVTLSTGPGLEALQINVNTGQSTNGIAFTPHRPVPRKDTFLIKYERKRAVQDFTGHRCLIGILREFILADHEERITREKTVAASPHTDTPTFQPTGPIGCGFDITPCITLGVIRGPSIMATTTLGFQKDSAQTLHISAQAASFRGMLLQYSSLRCLFEKGISH